MMLPAAAGFPSRGARGACGARLTVRRALWMLGRVETPTPAPVDPPIGPVSARGKFLWVGDEKLFIRAVSYGPFADAAHGAPFPEKEVVEADLAAIRALGANTIRTYTVPPPWLLDRASAHELRVLIGVPWTQHVCFLDTPAIVASIRGVVRAGVRATGDHPATLAYLLGNEIPPDIVRWYGPARVARFLTELVHDAKTLAPAVPCSYANFPSTEYLDVPELDFVAFNVYLHREVDFRRYLRRLQNLAGDRPLVLTEHGIDSRRMGEHTQAATLAWQVRAAFDVGVAGTCVFAWTDEWFAGGREVDDWSFGLVTRARAPKPALDAVRAAFAERVPATPARAAPVSVVVCAFNAAQTLDACLASLTRLAYPECELIVVNDGSTDDTHAIAAAYPEVIMIDQPNRGLSAARNAGLARACGEIVAYTDADCVVDPDWLTYLLATLERDDVVAVGGPNIPPPARTAMAAYVAAAPGGPTHVLLNDEIAEHVPGCNMAFRRAALAAVGGFEPTFRTAGDDVDICWRLQNAGHSIAFSPAAVVWHERRDTASGYVRQQRGYGKAEALLYFRHPYRFNMLGQSRWLGRIYGDVTTSLLSRRPVIYSGTFGRGMFQTLYEPASSLLAFLPFTLEWNLASVVLILTALGAGGPFGAFLWMACLPLVLTVGSAVVSAWRATIERRHDRLSGRLVLAALMIVGPVVRGFERARWRLRGLGEVERVRFAEPTQRPRVRWRAREFQLAYWAEAAQEKEALLEGLIGFLVPRKYLVAHELGWSTWDLEVHCGVSVKARVRVAVEVHGECRRLFRVRCGVVPSRAVVLVLIGALAAMVAGVGLGATGVTGVAGAVAGLVGGVAVARAVQLGRTLFRVLEIVAQQIGLMPVDRRS